MNTSINTGDFSADRPIRLQSDDRFQRYTFSKNIAESIMSRQYRDCIVYGIFGEWGEGKTSVLNFIEEELKKDEKFLIVKFNPWRYMSEDLLLKNFFEKIADVLGEKLESNLERFIKFIDKYGKSFKIPMIDIGAAARTLTDKDIAIFCERVEAFLEQSTSRIVVFIDDIDRLEKQEINAVFRLVKLTAEFRNTTYVLSCDDIMVSAALAERYANGKEKPGSDFLEKIIQHPMRISKAQPVALKKFFFELIQTSIAETGMLTPAAKSASFLNEFTKNVLPLINTPRLVIRFASAFNFAASLLMGEVDLIDLMLIEAVKIFYPNIYRFIRDNASCFVEGRLSAEKITGYNFIDDSQVENIVKVLFPFETVYDKLYYEKRIASSFYFEKYFNYAVMEGDISDKAFKELWFNMAASPIQPVINQVSALLAKSNPVNFIRKLKSLEHEISWSQVQQVTRAICILADLFPNLPDNAGELIPSEEAADFIFRMLKMYPSEPIFSLAEDMIKCSANLSFCCHIDEKIRSGCSTASKIFTIEEFDWLAEILCARAVNDAGDLCVYEKFPEEAAYIVSLWAEIDREKMWNHTLTYLDKDINNVFSFFRSFSIKTAGDVSTERYESDITEMQYEWLVTFSDAEAIVNRILQKFSMEEVLSFDPVWDGYLAERSDLDMARQFLFWYKKGISPIEHDEHLFI